MREKAIDRLFHAGRKKQSVWHGWARSRNWIWLVACMVTAIGSGGAQAPARSLEPSVMRDLNRAVRLAEGGEKSQALVLANTLVTQHPDFVPALKLQGFLLEEAGRGDDAGRAYGKALQFAPNDPGLLMKLGTYQLAAGNEKEAISFLLRHLAILPKDGDALYYLAQAYHLIGQNEQALRTIRQCAKIQPDNAQVLQKYGELLRSSGESEAGLHLLMKAKQIDPSLERIDFDIGIVRYDSMDFPAAVKYAARAAEKQPTDSSVLALLAAAEVKLSQWREAQSVFERILTIKKNDVTSLLGLGHCDLELNQYQAASDILQKLLQLDPPQPITHYYLSRALAGLGRKEEAQHEAELHHMMEQMSFASPALVSEGGAPIWQQARQLLTEHREDEALRLFQQASRSAPANPGDAYVLLGALYLSMGNAEDGLLKLHRALEIEPTVRGAHTYTGMAALQQGDLAKAENEFDAELANDPNYQTATAELGEVRYRQQRWSEATDLLLKSRTRTPSLMYMLCDSYFHMGNVSDADLTAEVLAAFSRNDLKVMEELTELLIRHNQTELAQRLSSSLKP
jgi:tetratricopeptide (TPR) repeat protein